MKKKSNYKMPLKRKIISVICILYITFFSFFLFLFYGPINSFKEFWITSAMTTMNHQYLATFIYSDKYISVLLESNDFRFVNAFANNYIKFHECLSTAPEVREFAMQSIREEKKSNYFNKLDENNDNPLVRMTKLLIYKYYQSPSGKVEYTDKITYRNLHSIIAFVNHYDKKYLDEVSKEQNTLFEDNSKKKVLKKDRQIDGQISLFD